MILHKLYNLMSKNLKNAVCVSSHDNTPLLVCMHAHVYMHIHTDRIWLGIVVSFLAGVQFLHCSLTFHNMHQQYLYMCVLHSLAVLIAFLIN